MTVALLPAASVAVIVTVNGIGVPAGSDALHDSKNENEGAALLCAHALLPP